VAESIEVPEDCSPKQFQWAVFCAASVEYLCKKYALPCPEWALNPRYSLEEPWYYDISADLPEVQAELRQTTPEPFTKRNIFCGAHIMRYLSHCRRKTATQDPVQSGFGPVWPSFRGKTYIAATRGMLARRSLTALSAEKQAHIALLRSSLPRERRRDGSQMGGTRPVQQADALRWQRL
jgi:hypothetical protein